MAREYGAAARLASKDGGRFSNPQTAPPYVEVAPNRVVGSSARWLAVLGRVLEGQGMGASDAELLARAQIQAVLRDAGWQPAGGLDEKVPVKTGMKFR